jgi:hypothetical protein
MAITRKRKTDKVEITEDITSTNILSSQATPMVFISHDNRDAELAESFSKLLRSVSAGVLKSFRSSDRKGAQGIEYGVEWYPDIMSKLNQASDVVCLLTQRSVERPWILYEAGVAKGKLETPVLGLALGIPLNQASTGPFAQFQNCEDNEDSLTQLVMQLVRRIPNAEPDRDVIQIQVRAFKQEATTILEKLDNKGNEQEGDLEDDTSVAKLFEEVKVMFQELPTRIEKRVDPSRRRKYGRLHPKMIHELLYLSKEFGDSSVGLLVAVSYLREQAPWMYEIGVEAYRAIQDGDTKKIEKAYNNFRAAIEVTRHFSRYDKFEDEETYFMMREIPMLMEEFFKSLPLIPVKSKKKVSQAEETEAANKS